MALADTLHGLLRLPGATYACIVERDSGRVLAEAGHGESGAGDGEGVVPYSVARWGTAVAAMFDATSGDDLDDVMITGRRSYHLLRSLGANATVLAYLRLDRTRSNLAAARRELGAVRWGGAGTARPAAPLAQTAPSGARRGDASSRDSPTGRAEPRAAESGAAGSRPPDQRGAEWGRSPGARRRPAEPRAAQASSAEPLPVQPRVAAVRPGPRAAQPRSAPTALGSGTSAARAASVSRVPASLPPPSTPARGLRSVDGPGGGPRDDTRAERSAERVAERAAEPADLPRIPLPRRAPTHPPADTSRRRGGTRGTAGSGASAAASAAPEGFAMPAVLGQSWAQDPSTLRRLIAGLRRMH